MPRFFSHITQVPCFVTQEQRQTVAWNLGIPLMIMNCPLVKTGEHDYYP